MDRKSQWCFQTNHQDFKGTGSGKLPSTKSIFHPQVSMVAFHFLIEIFDGYYFYYCSLFLYGLYFYLFIIVFIAFNNIHILCVCLLLSCQYNLYHQVGSLEQDPVPGFKGIENCPKLFAWI